MNAIEIYENAIRMLEINGEITLGEFEDMIKPLEDVSPVVYGEWKHTVTGYPYCSNCDWMPEEDEMLHTDYFCPNCGAKMDGKK